MEKLTVVGNFVKYVELLRNTECSQKDKVHHFHQISECLTSPSMISNEHFGKHASSAVSVLLLFCEDLDSVVRMSAEENLNKVVRSVENSRLSRVLSDLYNEIKKNGNQKSLRICLNMFAYYSPRIKEKNCKWYAIKLLPCLQAIAQRKETLLLETLAEFVKCYSQNLQICLSDNETTQLLGVFLADITSDCAVKRRYSAQCCIHLIQNSRNIDTMARRALGSALGVKLQLHYNQNEKQLSITDSLQHSDLAVNNIVGVLGFLRLLLPLIISQETYDCKQIIEIYDVCLYLLNNCNHAIINASLEVINAILNTPDRTLREIFLERNLHQVDFLKKRKSLKNQIFHLKTTEMACSASQSSTSTSAVQQDGKKRSNYVDNADGGLVANQHNTPRRKSSTETIKDALKSDRGCDADEHSNTSSSRRNRHIGVNAGQDSASSSTNEIKFIIDDSMTTSTTTRTTTDSPLLPLPSSSLSSPNKFCRVTVNADSDSIYSTNANEMTLVSSEPNESESQEEGQFLCIEDKSSQMLSDVDNESFNSIDFESEITIGCGIDYELSKGDDEKADDVKSLKSTDSSSIGAFFNNLLSHPNTETVTKLFRPSAKLSGTATDQQQQHSSFPSASRPKAKQTDTDGMEFTKPTSQPRVATATTIASVLLSSSTGVALTLEDDTISLESINSHISLSSHVSGQSSTQDFARNEQDLVMVQRSECDDEMESTKSVGGNVVKELGNSAMKLNESFAESRNEMDTINANKLPGENQSKFESNSSPFRRNASGGGSGGQDLSFQRLRLKAFVFDDVALKFNIGNIYDQNIIHYTARLIASKFLLNGNPGGLQSDALVRVSIKNLALIVIANCVRLRPEVLYLSLEIDSRAEMQPSDAVSEESGGENSSSGSGHDFEMTEQLNERKRDEPTTIEENLLEIKDDHFGECTTSSFLFNSPLSKSADHILLAQLQNPNFSRGPVELAQNIGPKRNDTRTRLNHQLEQILSKSEIIESSTCLEQAKSNLIPKTPTQLSAAEAGIADKHDGDVDDSDVPINISSFDPKSNRNMSAMVTQKLHGRLEHKNSVQNRAVEHDSSMMMTTTTTTTTAAATIASPSDAIQLHHQKQFIHDIFLYCNHSDPVLRGNMQIIACNFIKACLSSNCEDYYKYNDDDDDDENHGDHHMGINEATNMQLLHGSLDFEKLLNILIKGFRDEIHTVVIQALTSFDRIFYLLMSNYFIGPNVRRHWCSKDNNLNDSNVNDPDDSRNDNSNNDDDDISRSTKLSPKLLLNELQFCYKNKYWLVQNKYADVISNLPFDIIREYCGDDIAVSYEDMFLHQLLRLLGDDDVRVRDHVAVCLCLYIQKSPSKSLRKRSKQVNDFYAERTLLEEFCVHRVFRRTSLLLCEVLKHERKSDFISRGLLSRVLFQLTNKLMDLGKKNFQFGIINAIRVLLSEFSVIDHLHIWNEFNLLEICCCFMYQNFMAIDINMQISLIEINTKLLTANLLTGNNINPEVLVDNLFGHIMKVLNIYYYLFANQKPTILSKSVKTDLFTNTKEIGAIATAAHNSEDFSSDDFYIKLYHILKAAYENYRITINQESGNKLMSLIATCLNALSTLLEFKTNTANSSTIKLIDEILQYLNVIINYSPIEGINCLRQLLKFLFCRNYGNRKLEYENFLKLYFVLRHYDNENFIDKGLEDNSTGASDDGGGGMEDDGRIAVATTTKYKQKGQSFSGEMRGHDQQDANERQKQMEKDCSDRFNLSKLFANAISFPLGKSKLEEDCAKHIKLFEPLVIYCLTLFMKSNAIVQSTILDMLSQLLDFNVTYSILDSKHIIFEQVERNVELIEAGTARNSSLLIASMLNFLIKLTKQNDKKLTSIPKIISITNNLFANNTHHDCSVAALKELALEIFFRNPTKIEQNATGTTASTTTTSSAAAYHIKERNTEREVIVRMLEQFINSLECQKMLAILLLWARASKTRITTPDIDTDSTEVALGTTGTSDITTPKATTTATTTTATTMITIVQERAILSIVTGALQNDKINVNNCESFLVLNSIFRNCDKSILLGSDLFETLLALFMKKTVENFNNLSYAIIILDNVILKTEEIYLANHIKLLFKKNSLESRVDRPEEQSQPEHENEQRRHRGQYHNQQHQRQDKMFEFRQDLLPNDEINYFVKVLYSMLETCFSASMSATTTTTTMASTTLAALSYDKDYVVLTSKYVQSLIGVTLKFDKMKSSLRTLFVRNDFYGKFERCATLHRLDEQLKVDILMLLCEICLMNDQVGTGGSSSSSGRTCKDEDALLILQPSSILQHAQKVGKIDRRKILLRKVCEKFNHINYWMTEDIKILLSKEFLVPFLANDSQFKCNLLGHSSRSSILFEELLSILSDLPKELIPDVVNLVSASTQCSSFLKLKILWTLFIDDKKISRSLQKLIQLQIDNEVQSRLQRSDCRSHRSISHVDIINEILSRGDFLTKLSPSTRTALHRFEKELHDDDDKHDMEGGPSLNASSDEGSEQSTVEFDTKCFQEEINEKWLMQQVVSISSKADCKALARVLMDFKSEIKLKTIFNAEKFSCDDILSPCLEISFHTMITSFQNNCVQYSPHINYMNINPLLRVTLQIVLQKLETVIEQKDDEIALRKLIVPITTMMLNLQRLESQSLMFIKLPAIAKFIREQLLKSQVPAEKLLIEFAMRLANYLSKLINDKMLSNDRIARLEMEISCRCLDEILKEKFVWMELNQAQKYEQNLNVILDMLYDGMVKSIRNTIFYKRYWMQSLSDDEDNNKSIDDTADGENGKNVASGNAKISDQGDTDSQMTATTTTQRTTTNASNTTIHMRKAIFLGKLIECSSMDDSGCRDDKISMKFIYSRQLMKFFKSIAISVLRTNQFYGLAVIPHELFHTFGFDNKLYNYAKLPSIPVDHLSDVDVLQKFIKRLSIFGFTMRQQFEEYFMTFLLLINRVYDENMVDEQEQNLIKNVCLTIIIELLIICRTFPWVGNKLSKFHHSTRWSRIKCRNNISLKKLHKVQLIIPGSNIFYHPNTERNLFAFSQDSIIGTNYFLPNQYELNQVWQEMESVTLASTATTTISSSTTTIEEINSIGNVGFVTDIDEIKEDTSGIDLKSSCQLIFDVFTQMIEQNHTLVLPNLVKFCEICDNREQIRSIKNTVVRLQEQIPFDDTISHQYIIYLLCRTQSILVPSFAELSHLCSIISKYLKSTHVFIRNATLYGLLCLFECCSKTSTSLGKLSEELCLLREIIVGYITRHGIIDESSTVFSDMHTKLVWTLNFSLIEMTTKFVADCHLLSNTIISANNLLKRTTNEAIYLCIIHGLERIIVVHNVPKPISDKIEKLALELVKLENERFSMPALKLLLSCVYMGSSKQLEMTEHSNGIVQDDPEIIAQQTEKVDALLQRIKSSTSSAARIYGEVLCQIVRDLVPPNEILTRVIKEFLAINQPHCEVIARIVYQVFRSCIDSSFLRMLQDWLICSLPNFLTIPPENGVWCLTVIFLSSSINLDLIKLFPFALNESKRLKNTKTLLFIVSARDFYMKLNAEQKTRFKDIFKDSELEIFMKMLKCL